MTQAPLTAHLPARSSLLAALKVYWPEPAEGVFVWLFRQSHLDIYVNKTLLPALKDTAYGMSLKQELPHGS